MDADALDRRRAQEAEEWRLEQLRKGVPGENANFQVPCLQMPAFLVISCNHFLIFKIVESCGKKLLRGRSLTGGRRVRDFT